jgi:hypothetical protein
MFSLTDATEAFYKFIREHEILQLDELILTLGTTFSFYLTIFALRRWFGFKCMTRNELPTDFSMRDLALWPIRLASCGIALAGCGNLGWIRLVGSISFRHGAGSICHSTSMAVGVIVSA